ncbi:MAG: NosD domain-containing protein [Candidatus Odinarchaeota archaeon]
MKRASKIVICLLVSFLVFSLIPSQLEKNTQFPCIDEIMHNVSVIAPLQDSMDFIEIEWLGNGTEIDPFVLENQTLGSLTGGGYLSISSSNDYRVLKNCQLLLMVCSFREISNLRIIGCTFINSTIHFYQSQDCGINENEFLFNYGHETVTISDSTRFELKQNRFEYGFDGISIVRSNDTIISGNRFVSLTRGGVYGDFTNITLVNNIFEGTGINMLHWNPQQAYALPFVSNNTVNGKYLALFLNITDARIDAEQYGQIILGNCNNTVIIGGTFSNCGCGVELTTCDNITLYGATVSDCSWNGIEIYQSTKITLADCTITNCSNLGVFLTVSPFYKIINCSISDNLEGGITSHVHSNNGTVMNSNISGNHGAGLEISDNTTAIGNSVSYNTWGLTIYGAYCLVINNTVTYNNYTGISINNIFSGYASYPAYNRVFGNSIGWNGYHNAIDYGHSNYWDDGVSIGNSWSDYYGFGVYTISWDGIDHYPDILPNGSITLFQIHLILVLAFIGIITALIMVKLKNRFQNLAWPAIFFSYH